MEPIAAAEPPSLFGSFFRHLLIMPVWHRHVLLLAMIVAGVGFVGHVRQQFFGSAPTPSASQNGVAQTTNSQSPDANPQPWYLSPRMLGIGGSVLGGFIIGWIARMFLKMVAMIAVVIGAILFGLSYLHVMNMISRR